MFCLKCFAKAQLKCHWWTLGMSFKSSMSKTFPVGCCWAVGVFVGLCFIANASFYVKYIILEMYRCGQELLCCGKNGNYVAWSGHHYSFVTATGCMILLGHALRRIGHYGTVVMDKTVGCHQQILFNYVHQSSANNWNWTWDDEGAPSLLAHIMLPLSQYSCADLDIHWVYMLNVWFASTHRNHRSLFCENLN